MASSRFTREALKATRERLERERAEAQRADEEAIAKVECGCGGESCP
jgi:hypothetical protein